MGKIIKYFGNAGHLCVSSQCRFHICTQVGKYLISTVGEYFPSGSEKMESVGIARFYETMVFKITGECDCGCGLPMHDCSELEIAAYQTAAEANKGHEKLVKKYLKKL